MKIKSDLKAGNPKVLQRDKKELDRLKEKNRKLAAELQNRRRELEVETALEKVRGEAMSMKRPDDMPGVCRSIAIQLSSLGIHVIRNVQTAVFHPEQKTYTNYEYYFRHHKSFITETTYANNPIHHAFARKMMKGKGQVSVTHIKGREKLLDWLAYQKTTNVFIDKYLKTADSLNYYWYSLGPIALGISTYYPLDNDQQSLFVRFRDVFEFSYIRYLDLQNAQAQAREAQIEAALERVRSRSMAMRKSDELKEVIRIVLEQFVHLRIHVGHAGFYIDYKANDNMHIWLADPNIEPFYAIIPYFDTPTWNSFLDAKTKGKKFYTDLLGFKEKNKFYKSLFKLFTVPEEAKKFYLQCRGLAVSTVLLDQVGLYIENFDAVPYTDEENKILMRFAKVFEQTYTRFLDLQKAETQAREAQIEAALERTRTQSMLMQHSQELNNTISVFHEQLQGLGLDSEFSYLWLPDEDKSTHLFLTTWSEEENNKTIFKNREVVYPLNKTDPSIAACYVAWESGEPVHVNPVPPENVRAYFATWAELLNGIEKFKPKHFKKGLYYVDAYMKYGCFGIVIRRKLKDEEKKILARFTKEFEQSYTRFLDLQKAEAQARDAQIEAALERVRSRSIGMQKSIELGEVVFLVDREIAGLGIRVDNTSIITDFSDPLGNGVTNWFAARGRSYLEKFHIPFIGSFPLENRLIDELNKRSDFYSEIYSKAEKNEYFEWLFKNSDFKSIAPERQRAVMNAPGWTRAVLLSKNSSLIFQRFRPEEYSEEDINIFKRFGKVFEQSYTRFLDLQKAEAQAREAQIQLALERVRARSLAMHNTSELQEVVHLAAQQLLGMGMDITGGVFICINEEVDRDLSVWASGGMADYVHKVKVPVLNKPIFTRIRDAIKKGNDFLTEFFSDKEKREFFKHLFQYEPWRSLPEERKKELMSRKGGFARSVVISRYTGISITNHHGKTFSEEENGILKRFGKVFEQAYIRFLDLQKAETQAREAQIQLAMERVRARTMAMQTSHELPEAANLLFQQVQSLGMPAWSAGYCIWDEDKKAITLWMSSEGVLQPPFKLPLTEDPSCIRFLEAHQKGEGFYIEEIGGEDLVKHYHYMRSLPVVGDVLKSINDAGFPLPSFQVFHCVYFLQGFLLFITYEPVPEAYEIFKRFGMVFEQTYTRFLDLQKAEAQAREAQIEAALEKVRSRSMAMQNSGELKEVIQVVYGQFVQLNIPAEHTGFIMDYKARDDYYTWIADRFGSPSQATLPYFDCIYYNRFNEAKKEGTDFFTLTLNRDEKNRFYKDLFKHIPGFPEASKKFIFSHPGFTISTVLLENVALYIENFTGVPYSEEENAILMRFGKVFQQTYTRFLDLQKAEAQARESQIEASLERVRSKAMAMHNSQDLADTIGVFYKELYTYNIIPRRCGVGLLNTENKVCEIFTWNTTEQGEGLELIGKIQMEGHPVLEKVYSGWLTQTDYFPVLRGNEINEYYRVLRPMMAFPDYSLDQVQYGYFFFFKEGGVYAWTDHELKNEELQIYRRFTTVLSLTYKRFKDLQHAEAQAREAQIQLAMERVRARAMAMQKSTELGEASAMILKQFNDLGYTPDTMSIGIFNEDTHELELWATGREVQQEQKFFKVPLTEKQVIDKVYQAWKQNEKSIIVELSGEPLLEYISFWRSLGFYDEEDDKLTQLAIHCALFSKGYIGFITPSRLPSDEMELLERFAGVFGLTYQRFFDLQKAEAQAREARIETALERVRSRTMAMHKSDELIQAAELLFEQIKQLGAETQGVAFAICDRDSPMIQKWTSIGVFSHPYTIEPGEERMYEAWKNQTGLYEEVYEGEKQKKYYEAFMEIPAFRQGLQKFIDNGYPIPTWQKNHAVTFKHGYLLFITTKPFNETQIFLRFGKVFEQTYTRFLDLQKAEAQAREAQIEVSLERVRSRAMAMQSSDELKVLISTLFTELTRLDLALTRCILWVFEPASGDARWWMANSEDPSNPVSFFIRYHEYPAYLAFVDAWKRQAIRFVYDLKGQDKQDWDQVLFNETELKNLPDEIIQGMRAPGRVILSGSFNNFGGINTASLEPLSDEQFEILLRFAKVFDLTYTRFLDLKKAEAQARESQIQLALERVRARTMAMHRSEELAEAAQVLFQQLLQLGSFPDRISISIVEEANDLVRFWSTDQAGGQINSSFVARSNEETVISKGWRAWKEDEKSLEIDLRGEELKQWMSFVKEEMKIEVDERQFQGRRVHTLAFFSHGWLMLSTHQPADQDTLRILERFAAVFSLTYRRYLDLHIAEESAREALIEASLEKVRGQAMAMHNSSDLSDTILLAYSELKKFELHFLRFGVGLLNKETRKAQLYSAASSVLGDSLALIGWIHFEGHPVFEAIYDHWIRQEDYFPVLEGELLKSYYDLLLTGLSVPNLPNGQQGEKQYGYFFPHQVSCLYAWSEYAFPEIQTKILKRFASIIELTFRRYLELQQAELGAREAIKQSSLDRVRAEIASMRNVGDLNRLTPIIWKELNTLGVPFFRCGVFIMNESEQMAHAYLSTPDGQSLGVLDLAFEGAEITSKTVEHWRRGTIFMEHWDRRQFMDWVKTLQNQGQVQSADTYQAGQEAPDSLTLQFVPFDQGMLYVGSREALSPEQLSLVRELAHAFSMAYARYEDFKKLEEAKGKIESTLTDLRAAQSQLIQSEKMASLGELTAGIAHEIQNPLNFVNNFSEVNAELIDEIKQALNSGHSTEALKLTDDIKQNLEKINFHGKRADGIVKSMLQHSRSSEQSGKLKKEPTDINTLADEYLRLAYHGLRAKDQSFNATLKTDFDPTIGLIQVIPQDIARAMLNLITNAFYAVQERGKKMQLKGESFSPTVSVTTKKVGDSGVGLAMGSSPPQKVEIRVKDNGPGIPPNVLDKIFQPFFTTKPTGQGTGLGLSLAYDIIKAHEGSIIINSNENEGAEFIIQLPILNKP